MVRALVLELVECLLLLGRGKRWKAFDKVEIDDIRRMLRPRDQGKRWRDGEGTVTYATGRTIGIIILVV